MSSNPLGHNVLGQARYGDLSLNSIRSLTSAITVSYTTVGSPFATALSVSYSAQWTRGNTLLIYYLTTPTPAFSINGDTTIISPDRITYVPRPVVSRTLIAGPILQGYDSMQWTYTVLMGTEFTHLFSFYDPTNPVVTLVFPDKTGTWVQRQVVMHPPTYGSRTTVVVNNAVLSFTRL